jgi:UDPglucose 6-dehydrogenase
MQLTMIGAGYVGLVSAACFASMGHDVTCIDQDTGKISLLRNNTLPIFEADLDSLFQEAVNNKRLGFTTNLTEAVEGADAIFIAVDTPPMEDGRADLSSIIAVAHQLAKTCRAPVTIVVKSTVPPGTARLIARLIGEANPKLQFEVASNPEFLRQGSAVKDFLQPDRIVIGFNGERARNVLKAVYQPLQEKGLPLVETDVTTAELIKYASNAFLAIKVAYTNELAMLCGNLGGNIDDLVHAVGLDQRIGSTYLKPGPGYGGSCFPKDVSALSALAQEADSPVRIVEAVSLSNSHHVRRLVRGALDFCADHWGVNEPRIDMQNRQIAILGLTFKAGTDDVRNSVSLVVISQLLNLGARVHAFDPKGTEKARAHFPAVRYVASPEEALIGADAAIVMTDWPPIQELRPQLFRKLMRHAVVIDYRNMFEPLEMAMAGVEYMSLGRPYLAAVEPSPAKSPLLSKPMAKI